MKMYKAFIYIDVTRTVSMMQDPLYVSFCGIAFAFLGVVVALKVAKPWVDNMLALENS